MKLIHKAALPLLAACAYATLTPAMAETEREHGSHEHGVAQLRIAIEGSEWFIELESPLANILGFEHAPENEAQLKLAQHSFDVLHSASSVIDFKRIESCKMGETEQAWPFDPSAELDHDEKHDDDEHGDHEEHHDEHDADDHKAHMEDPDHEHHDEHHDDEHKDHHNDHEDQDEVHGEIVVQWNLECTNAKLPESIQFPVMTEFKGMHNLELEIIHPAGFISNTITSDKQSVKIK